MSSVQPNDQASKKRGQLRVARLGIKLRQIRLQLGLSQGQILPLINPTELTGENRARISQYESGARVPSLVEIANYAKLVGIPIAMLAEDNLDLPFS